MNFFKGFKFKKTTATKVEASSFTKKYCIYGKKYNQEKEELICSLEASNGRHAIAIAQDKLKHKGYMMNTLKAIVEVK